MVLVRVRVGFGPPCRAATAVGCYLLLKTHYSLLTTYLIGQRQPGVASLTLHHHPLVRVRDGVRIRVRVRVRAKNG